MAIHPNTVDGYFVSGNPLTGERPEGSIPSLEFFNALLDLLGTISSVPSVAINAETTLDADYGVIWAESVAGETLLIHLPVYASVGGGKHYRIINVGQGLVRVNAIDGKLIDGQASLDLAPGDKSGEIAKYGTHWWII